MLTLLGVLTAVFGSLIIIDLLLERYVAKKQAEFLAGEIILFNEKTNKLLITTRKQYLSIVKVSNTYDYVGDL